MVAAQIKNAFISIGEVNSTLLPGSLVLKIAISSQYIRYFVQSSSHSQVIFFGEYTLHHVENTEDLCQRLDKIFDKDDILQLPFAKTYVGLDGPYTLLPAAFSSPAQYAHNVFNQPITQLGLNMTFEADGLLVDKILSLFETPSVLHINSSLLNCYPLYLEKEQKKLFINIGQNYFDALLFAEAGGLQLMNRYSFKTHTDFVYFLLLCCDQLGIDREKTELVLSGEVDIQSKIYDGCYRYFRAISFIRAPEGLHFSRAFDLYPKHLHFNLYNLGV